MRAVVLALLLGALPAAGQERVLEFHSNVRIGADGALTVTETIAVQAEGREIRRGILRDFPTDYRGRFGEKVRVPFTVLLVTRSGNAEPWTTQRLSNGVRVRIAGREVVRDDLGVDVCLTDPAGDELGVLGPEVEDEDGVVLIALAAHGDSLTGRGRGARTGRTRPAGGHRD